MSSSREQPLSTSGSGGSGGSGGAPRVLPVRVAVRIRPISSKEVDEGCQSVISVVPGRPQVMVMDKAFTFDHAFEFNSCQTDVYAQSVSKMIRELFEGYNATVLAYGQTGSGKTHSMGTTYQAELTSPKDMGIIPRAVQDIFEEIDRRRDELQVNVSVAFIELYREQLYDLLSGLSQRKEECVCDIREDPVKGIVIPNLTTKPVGNLGETMRQLEAGSLKRVTAATAMNNTSSRSHAIFTLFLNIVDRARPEHVTVSKFHLVDLAGSERVMKTKATGDRYKEGVAINQGLLALGNVISVLGEESKKLGGGAGHVPYRNSKLTRLLQDSLGGNSHTLMVACVSPADSNVEETMSTLRYADRARQIKNKPIVNTEGGKDAEMNRLRLENAELRLQLKQAGGGGAGGAGANAARDEELKLMGHMSKKLKEENDELTKALVGCQGELVHMNEKLLMRDASDEKIKAKLQELLAEMDVVISKSDCQMELLEFKKKIADVVDVHTEAERTMMEHEVAHADSSTINENDLECASGGGANEEYAAAEHALKHSALNTQLQDLNKLLAQKEKLSSDMCASDQKLAEIRQQYEQSLNTNEQEMLQLQKERDELAQQQKHAPSSSSAATATATATSTGNNAAPSNKIAEQRRKRIQDLEQQIQSLRKKMLEQQKAIKMNEKNAAQVKKLNEEIREMKQAKVKLVRQIREDTEKARVWKQKQLKEVQALKQSERKQQAKMVKMENLHTKQQCVMRRKMEEAAAINKRLKEVVEKQRASKKSELSGVKNSDRLRAWVDGEMDVMVSVKEATRSRQQLIEDRKVLMKQINDLNKNKMDETMDGEEMESNNKKMGHLKSEVDSLNVQITNLQKQITDLDQDNATASANTTTSTVMGPPTSKSRFNNVRSMTEAKIMLDHLFSKSVEQTVAVALTKSEFTELKQLYEEAVKNTNNLESEISSIKNDYQAEKIRSDRQHEEKVLYLLNKMTDASEKEKLEIHEAEITKFSKLHEELIKMCDENEKLRKKMTEEVKNMQLEDAANKSKVKKSSAKKAPMTEYAEPSSEEEEDDFSDGDDGGDDDNDPDWRGTPLFKRIKGLRKTSSFLTVPGQKRKLQISGADDVADDGIGFVGLGPKPAKRSSANSTLNGAGCRCKTDCSTRRCKCKKAGTDCDKDICGCDADTCRQRFGGGDGGSFNDTNNASSLSASSSRNALNDISNNDTANTLSMLNETYGLKSSPTDVIFKSPSASTSGLGSAENRRISYFKSPL